MEVITQFSADKCYFLRPKPTVPVRFNVMQPSLQLTKVKVPQSHCTTIPLHIDHQSSSMYSTSFIPFRFVVFIHASLTHYIKPEPQNIL